MIVLDTHALIWVVNDDPRLGSTARATIDDTVPADFALISAITPWEIALLAEKGRLHLGREVGSWIKAVLALPGIKLAPVEPEIAVDSVRLPGSLHADPADRIIVATALGGHRLLTADDLILGWDGELNRLDARE
jgi:PIN domain nuclease of toxin-antitoxin system